MLNFLDPNTLARTYRDPVAIVILAVDLFPIWAVLTLGWGAAPLVFLYWLENDEHFAKFAFDTHGYDQAIIKMTNQTERDSIIALQKSIEE